MARAVNLSPVNSPRKTGKFATDFYGKFDGEPSKAAAKSVKFERETRAKTPALPQIKFDQNANLNRSVSLAEKIGANRLNLKFHAAAFIAKPGCACFCRCCSFKFYALV